jgi:hypothetical protein
MINKIAKVSSRGLIICIIASFCHGENYDYDQLNKKINQYKSIQKTGTLFLISGILFVGTSIIIFNTNKQPEPPWIPDENYENIQKIGGGFLLIGIPAFTVGSIMTYIGINRKRKYSNMEIQYNSENKNRISPTNNKTNDDSLIVQETIKNEEIDNNKTNINATENKMTEDEKDIIKQLKSIELREK